MLRVFQPSLPRLLHKDEQFTLSSLLMVWGSGTSFAFQALLWHCWKLALAAQSIAFTYCLLTMLWRLNALVASALMEAQPIPTTPDHSQAGIGCNVSNTSKADALHSHCLNLLSLLSPK